jgi:tRNA threonylcarbamoyladenosine biosynthesis protein TsaE
VRRDESPPIEGQSHAEGQRHALVVETSSPDETRAVGAALARSFAGAARFSLEGDLGSGKTVLVRGICEGLGVEEDVTSPTYTLRHDYVAGDGRPVLHVDCFRLKNASEAAALALEESDDAVVLVEWGDRVRDELPPDTVRISIEMIDETKRRIRIEVPSGWDLS